MYKKEYLEKYWNDAKVKLHELSNAVKLNVPVISFACFCILQYGRGIFHWGLNGNFVIHEWGW